MSVHEITIYCALCEDKEKEIEELKTEILNLQSELSFLKENAKKAQCAYCGEFVEKNREAMWGHMYNCEEHPINKLLKSVA